MATVPIILSGIYTSADISSIGKNCSTFFCILTVQTFIRYFLAHPRMKITASPQSHFSFYAVCIITHIYEGGSLPHLGNQRELRFVCSKTVPEPSTDMCVHNCNDQLCLCIFLHSSNIYDIHIFICIYSYIHIQICYEPTM